ncbi:hypothetical protein ACQJBY_030454 [Aegilops geniculata]
MTQQPWTPHLPGNVAATDWYLLGGNSKLHVHWENHDESLMNTVKDEKENSSIPRAVRDFVLPAGFLGECWYPRVVWLCIDALLLLFVMEY